LLLQQPRKLEEVEQLLMDFDTKQFASVNATLENKFNPIVSQIKQYFLI
jgi:hypothetical protein